MNNEPVAWKITNGKTSWLAFDQSVAKEPDEVAIPLYTHPAKTLTDEEIIALWNDMVDRQLLRKAQEK